MVWFFPGVRWRQLVRNRHASKTGGKEADSRPGQEQTGSEPDRQAGTKCSSGKRATEGKLARSERGADRQVWSE